MTKTKRDPIASVKRSETALLKEQLVNASQLNDAFLLCRLVGHSWDRIAPDRVPMFGRIVTWQCMRCTTKRDDMINPNVEWQGGMLLARTYRYPEGYKVPNPEGHRGRGNRALSVPALRLALLRRDDAITD